MSATQIAGSEEEEADAITEQLVTTEEDLTENPDLPRDDEAIEEIPELHNDELEEANYNDNRSENSGKEGETPRDSWDTGENDDDEELKNIGENVQKISIAETESSGEDGEDEESMEFLKTPASIGDFMENWDVEEFSARSSKSSINILELTDLTHPEAAIIAEYILGLLEEDLALYVQRTGVVFPEPLTKEQLKRMRRGLTEKDSASSFDSELSDILPGEPSKIRMTYEKGVSVYTDLSLLRLPVEEKFDKEVQVNLHRDKTRASAGRFSRYSQTLEMTFIPMETALLIFKQMYPLMDDFKVREPPSRQISQEFAISKAKQADSNIDSKRKGPQIISLSNKKQLLQPLMDDYHKDEKFWTGSRFTGEYRNRKVFKGRYDHPTGVKIESEFINGHFETTHHLGLVSYPRGDTFEGEWRRGRYQTGQITFCDGLKFATTDWKYCEPPDRRFKVERYYGIKPAGNTLFSDQYPAPRIPPGMYDTGDGFYNPKNGDVRGHDGFLLRQANETERNWVEKNCRKVHESIEHIAPNFLMDRIPGSYVETQKRIPLTKKLYH